jgi:hypothetical protein
MDLLTFLETTDAFHRAPVTKRALFPTGGAPYQPLLMLSVVRLFRRADRRSPIIEYREAKGEYRLLYERFYGPQDDATFGPKAAQPFWVFGSGRSIDPPIWTLVPQSGKERELENELATRKDPIKQEARLTELVKHAELPADTLMLLRNEIARRAIVSFTLQRYFPVPADVVEEL